MTVKDLLKELSGLNPNAEVIVETAVGDCELIYDVEDHSEYVKIYLQNDISGLCDDLFAEEQKNNDFDPYD